MNWRRAVRTGLPKGGGGQSIHTNWRHAVHIGVPKGGGRQSTHWRHIVHKGVPTIGGGYKRKCINPSNPTEHVCNRVLR